MKITERLRQALRRTPLFPKMLVLTVSAGILLTVVTNYVETVRLGHLFQAELMERLRKQADVDRARFDEQVARYHEAVKLIVSQKKFTDYIASPRFSRTDPAVQYDSALPPWLPDASIMRHFISIQHAVLINGRGRVREVFQGTPDALPRAFLEPADLLLRLSHNQSYMTSIEGKPFVLAAQSVPDGRGGRAATLLIAHELNSDFLAAAHGEAAHDDIAALISGTPPRIIATNRPDIVPAGAAVDSLKHAYLMTGKSFFDWGASDLVLEYASFISRAEFERLNRAVIQAEWREHTIVAAVFILAFSLLILWLTGRVRQLASEIAALAHKRLDMEFPAASRGDEFLTLRDQFHTFIDEIGQGRGLLKKKAEEQLKEKTVYLDNVLQSSSLAMVAIDSDFRVKYYNAAAAAVFGYTPGYIVGKKLGEIDNEESDLYAVFQNAFDPLKKGGAYEDVLERPGRPASRFAAVAVRPILSEREERLGSLLIAQDITDRMRIEKDLLLFRHLVDQSNDAFFVIDPETGKILDVNENACTSLGYSRRELLALRIIDISVLLSDDASWRSRVETIQSRKSLVYESSHRRNDDSVFPVEISARFISQEGKGYVISVARDITERKKIEMELRIKENAIANAINGIAISDMNGTITYVNRSYARMLGYSDPREVLGRSLKEMAGSSETVEEIRAALRSTGSWVGENTGRRRDGSLVSRLMAASIVTDDAGNPVSVLGSFVDITERKKMEQALMASEQRYRSIVAAASDAIFVADAETGTILEVNPKAEQLLGLPASKIIGMHQSELHPPEDGAYYHEQFHKAVTSGAGIMVGEFFVVTAQGQKIPVEISVGLFEMGGRRLINGNFRDITERRRAEARLREHDRRQKAILSSIPDMAWLKDRESRFLAVNEPFGAACGIPPEDLVGKCDLDIWPPELAERYRADDRAVMESGARKQVEEPLVDAEGRTRRIETIKTPIFDERGEIIGTTGIARDVTERRLAEEALRQSEERLRRAQQVAHVGSWELDLETNRLIWSEEIYRIFEIDPSRFGASYDMFLNAVHPDDRDLVKEAYDRSVKNRTPYSIVHRMLMPDGRVKYMQQLGETTYDETGRPVRSMGTAQDITEQKRAEQELRESEDRLAFMIANSPAVIYTTRASGDYAYTFISANVAHQMGFEPSDFLNNRGFWSSRIHPDDAPRVMIDLGLLFEQGQISHEYRFLSRAGTWRWLRDDVKLISDDQGLPVEIIGAWMDIHERKRAQEELEASLREKEMLLREIHHRVKNNLQIISSLLYFQAKKVSDPEGLAVLHEGQDRLKSMILVHEKLYRSRDLARIEMSDFVRTLTEHMRQSYTELRGKVSISLELAELSLPIEIALPCGMILNELLTNVFKYAFPGERSGSAGIRMAAKSGGVVIEVSDNGVGLPASIDIDKPATFGLQLVRQLVAQLHGTVTVRRENGTIVRVEMPLAQARERS